MQNTRLIGITFPGAKEPGIQLERWGRKVLVNVPEESLQSIRQACFIDLPIASKYTTGSLDSCGYKVGTSSSCSVQVEMTPEFADLVSSVIRHSLEEEEGIFSEEDLPPDSTNFRNLFRFVDKLTKDAAIARDDLDKWRGGEGN